MKSSSRTHEKKKLRINNSLMKKKTRKHGAASTSRDKQRVTLPTDAGWWTVMQVAAFLELSYHTARNKMLSGVFGRSRYDAESKVLRVSAANVRAKAHLDMSDLENS